MRLKLLSLALSIEGLGKARFTLCYQALARHLSFQSQSNIVQCIPTQAFTPTAAALPGIRAKLVMVQLQSRKDILAGQVTGMTGALPNSVS